MKPNRAEGKRSLREIEDDDDEEDDQQEGFGFTGDETKKKGKRTACSGGAASCTVVCQVENCTADLRDAKRYHKRHKVCEFHAKSTAVFLAGVQQRFCQQCSRFHEIEEFDEAKRSCRRRLAGHNERRRKSLAEFQGEGSNQMG